MLQDDIKKKLSDVAAELKEKHKDLTPILEEISALIRSAIDDNFAQGGRWDGSGTDLFSGGSHRWKPLAESTEKAYSKLGYALRPTLYRSGTLLNSIEVNPFGTHSIAISSNLEYARIHQFGNEKRGSRLDRLLL